MRGSRIVSIRWIVTGAAIALTSLTVLVVGGFSERRTREALTRELENRLVLESRPGVLKLPRGPFLEASGGRKAYVVSGDTAELRAIETGATSVSEVEIVSGLEEGEVVVLSDTSRLEGAARVYLKR